MSKNVSLLGQSSSEKALLASQARTAKETTGHVATGEESYDEVFF